MRQRYLYLLSPHESTSPSLVPIWTPTWPCFQNSILPRITNPGKNYFGTASWGTAKGSCRYVQPLGWRLPQDRWREHSLVVAWTYCRVHTAAHVASRQPSRWHHVPATPSASGQAATATTVRPRPLPDSNPTASGGQDDGVAAGAACSTSVSYYPRQDSCPAPAHHLVIVDTEFRYVLFCSSISRRLVLSAFYLAYFSFLLPYIPYIRILP
jgi:hypothetical protein